jgi:hypothetical protein
VLARGRGMAGGAAGSEQVSIRRMHGANPLGPWPRRAQRQGETAPGSFDLSRDQFSCLLHGGGFNVQMRLVPCGPYVWPASCASPAVVCSSAVASSLVAAKASSGWEGEASYSFFKIYIYMLSAL